MAGLVEKAKEVVSSAMEEVTDIIPPPPLAAEAKGEAPGRGRLAGQKILVVGGGQSVNTFDPNPPMGNGRAICVLAAREGATVVVVDRSREAAQGTVDVIEKERLPKAHVIVADVSTPEGCSSLMEESMKLLGGQLDGAVIAVGIVGNGSSISQDPLAYWESVMNVNLRPHFLLLQTIGPLLEKASNGGSLVSIGSVAQILPASNEPAYHASKAGLSILMRNAAYKYAPAVRVNTVVPGLIDTPLGRSAGLKIKGRNASAVPLARQGTGWDVAYATVWLLSGESSFITAQDIVVDGGRVGTSQAAKKINGVTGVS